MLENGVDVVKKRLEIYEFLSYSYLNTPTIKLIEQVESNSKYLEELTGISSHYLKEESIKEYEQEYYDRFFVPKSKLFVPPYESAIRHRSKKDGKIRYGQLDSKETFHVKSCYAMVDFKVENLNAFKPIKDISYSDHIAFELSFMTYLISLEKNEVDKNNGGNAAKWRKLQKDFLITHLSKWIGDYAKITEDKNIGLYSYLTNIAAEWINIDIDYFLDESKLDKEVN